MKPQDTAQTADSPETRLGKFRAALLSLALVGAVLWPVHQNWRDKPRDNFPLSYYPMFSAKRDAIELFYYLVGLDDQGVRHYIRYKIIGTGGGNQVRRQLRRIVNERRSAELAKTVARRLARQEELPWSSIVTVNVCKGKFAVDDYFHGRKDPVEEQIKASCEVKRRPHETHPSDTP
jgi:hypothetical protein